MAIKLVYITWRTYLNPKFRGPLFYILALGGKTSGYFYRVSFCLWTRSLCQHRKGYWTGNAFTERHPACQYTDNLFQNEKQKTERVNIWTVSEKSAACESAMNRDRFTRVTSQSGTDLHAKQVWRHKGVRALLSLLIFEKSPEVEESALNCSKKETVRNLRTAGWESWLMYLTDQFS